MFKRAINLWREANGAKTIVAIIAVFSFVSGIATRYFSDIELLHRVDARSTENRELLLRNSNDINDLKDSMNELNHSINDLNKTLKRHRID